MDDDRATYGELTAAVRAAACRAVARLDDVDDDRAAYVGRIVGAVQLVVDAIARERDDLRDAARLRPLHPDMTAALGSLRPGADATGPVVGVLRRHAGLTRAQVAQAIGCSPSTVDRWEAGEPTRCHVGHMAAAADLLGVSPVAMYRTVATVAGWRIP